MDKETLNLIENTLGTADKTVRVLRDMFYEEGESTHRIDLTLSKIEQSLEAIEQVDWTEEEKTRKRLEDIYRSKREAKKKRRSE